MDDTLVHKESVESKSVFESLPVSTAGCDRRYEDIDTTSDDERYANSPSDNTSFHTADSMDSSLTEVNSDFNSEDEPEHVTFNSDQRFELPPGFESQRKLEVAEDSYNAETVEQKTLPDDSITERLRGGGNEGGGKAINSRRKPSIDIPSESTPLLIHGDSNSLSDDGDHKENSTECCVIL